MIKKILYSALLISCVFTFMAYSIANAEGESRGIVTASCLNLRAEPGTYAEIVDKLYYGTEVAVNDESEGWYNITYGSLTGWVSGAYLQVTEASAAEKQDESKNSGIAGTVTGNNVNVRNGPSTGDAVITRVNWGDNVTVISRSGDWYNVKLSDSTLGWIFSSYVSENAATSRSSSGFAGELLAFSRKFLGVGYVYGGSSPSGFDCSGFTKYVFGNFGITLNRIAVDQSTQGVRIDKGQLQPGDLVFFATSGGTYINHSGIYMGEGNFIHASSGGGSVMISNLWSGFYSNTYITARRMFR